ncbi:hypothetical protein TRFO_34450 [Tritrichomonas foetus]|uniref:Uncharacterized protein n=1 Tax=Tritrichomonas foetus TaxID=1144522 RepID=A0A1J4JL77_9EUKA|nr:hypothetical protein TRFO_34450 [Tritrichomonas foetus]|eukprot:OHS99167.1 hypothetical protein TRFO_34450 [Tritrichomonas foetus]
MLFLILNTLTYSGFISYKNNKKARKSDEEKTQLPSPILPNSSGKKGSEKSLPYITSIKSPESIKSIKFIKAIRSPIADGEEKQSNSPYQVKYYIKSASQNMKKSEKPAHVIAAYRNAKQNVRPQESKTPSNSFRYYAKKAPKDSVYQTLSEASKTFARNSQPYQVKYIIQPNKNIIKPYPTLEPIQPRDTDSQQNSRPYQVKYVIQPNKNIVKPYPTLEPIQPRDTDSQQNSQPYQVKYVIQSNKHHHQKPIRKTNSQVSISPKYDYYVRTNKYTENKMPILSDIIPKEFFPHVEADKPLDQVESNANHITGQKVQSIPKIQTLYSQKKPIHYIQKEQQE